MDKKVRLFEDVDVCISSETKAQLEQIDKNDLAKYVTAHNLVCMCSFAKLPPACQLTLLNGIKGVMKSGGKTFTTFAREFIENNSSSIKEHIDKFFEEMKECEDNGKT